MHVERSDSLSITFFSTGQGAKDTLLNEIYVLVNGVEKKYDNSNELGASILKAGRKQHQEYLNKILEVKKKEGFTYLQK
jgi:hypothetical protein